jgi:hypothetical protein
MADRQYLEMLSRKMADEGKLIEAGWVGMRLACIPDNAPAVQLAEMRFAFMAGAQHLFTSMLTILDPDDEPSEADMRKMELIDAELQAFGTELMARVKAGGRA